MDSIAQITPSENSQLAQSAGVISPPLQTKTSSTTHDEVTGIPSTNSVSHSDTDSQIDISRQEIIHTIFGEVGELINDFSCAVESTVLLHGRLYLTNRFLCFYSHLFGLEKKIRVPFSHISEIRKENTARVIPNAIAIKTKRKEYLFRSFWDREECYKLLQELITRYRLISPDRVRSLRNHPVLKSSPSSESILASPTVLAENTISNESSQITPKTQTSMSTEDEFADVLETDEGLNLDEDQNTIDYSEAFEEELKKSQLKMVVPTKDFFNVSVRDFATLFVEDNATHSWNKYQEGLGDTDFEVTSWNENSSVIGQIREMKFIKLIPAIRSKTRAVKVQKFRRFGDNGLVVCSSTRLEGRAVPASDSFSVEDMIAIKTVGENKVQVFISFEVKFLKSTMFRPMIESSTNNEMSKWFEVFYEHLKTVCVNHKPLPILSRARKSSRAVPLVSSPVQVSTFDNSAEALSESTAVASVQKLLSKEPVSNIHDNNLNDALSKSVEEELSAVKPISSKFNQLIERITNLVNRVGVFWSSWLILIVTFVFFGIQCQGVFDKLHSLEAQVERLQKTIEIIASQKDVCKLNL